MHLYQDTYPSTPQTACLVKWNRCQSRNTWGSLAKFWTYHRILSLLFSLRVRLDNVLHCFSELDWCVWTFHGDQYFPALNISAQIQRCPVARKDPFYLDFELTLTFSFTRARTHHYFITFSLVTYYLQMHRFLFWPKW